MVQGIGEMMIKEKKDMNFRDIDTSLYLQFKSAVYQSGYTTMKQAIETMMKDFIKRSRNSSIH